MLAFFVIYNSFLSSLSIVASSSSVNMERFKDRNVEIDTRVNTYVKKWRLLLVLNLGE